MGSDVGVVMGGGVVDDGGMLAGVGFEDEVFGICLFDEFFDELETAVFGVEGKSGFVG